MKKCLLLLFILTSTSLSAMQIGVLMGLPIYEDQYSSQQYMFVEEDDPDIEEVIYRARKNRIGIRITRPRFPPPVNRPR